ncbi:putative fumarate hydratase [Helianthus annuus]|nr:putative fumarate hydratase [Helianthus annuus]
MAMVQAFRRTPGGSAIVADSVRFITCWRHFSTAFREERDTFGPIQVPSDKFVFLFCLIKFRIFCPKTCVGLWKIKTLNVNEI